MRTLSIALLTFFAGFAVAADPVYMDREGKPLPPAAELAKLTGDAAKGATLMALCSTCHVINGAGMDFGPDLSDVGARKTKEQIIESILNPSAVIEPGYEMVMLKLKSGETAAGMIGSENDEEVVVKMMGGAKTTHKVADIESRTKQTMSVMPPGLQATMTKDDLVNLVEYLFSLKAKK